MDGDCIEFEMLPDALVDQVAEEMPRSRLVEAVNARSGVSADQAFDAITPQTPRSIVMFLSALTGRTYL